MKKYFTLCAALLLSATLFAQIDNPLRFVDKNGNAIADGTVLTFTETEGDKEIGWQIDPALAIENTSNVEQYAQVAVDVDQLSEGSSVKFCPWTNCVNYMEPGSYERHGYVSAKGKEYLMLEWILAYEEDEDGYWAFVPGNATVRLTANVLNGDGSVFSTGPTITLKFSAADPTGVEGVQADKQTTVVARYNANGQRIAEPTRGLNIIKMANGKTIKQIIK